MSKLAIGMTIYVIIILAIAVAIAFNAGDYQQSRCEAIWGQSGFETRWQNNVIGCMVLVDGRWVPDYAVRIEK